MSRSTRQRKPVNYRKLLDDESDNSDDDFASGPPPKKPRSGGPEGGSSHSVKGRGGDTQMKPAVEKDESKRQPRLSRDEKQFSKQIEQALVASKKESGTNISVSGDTTPSINTSSTECTAERSKDDDFVPNESVSSDESEGESFSVVEEDGDSDFSASPQPKKRKKKSAKENVKSAPKGRQTKAKNPNTTVSVSKFNANSLPKKAARPTTVKVTPAKPVVPRSSPSAARVPSLRVNSANSVKELKSSIKCEEGSPGVLGVNKRTLNWTPPAKLGEGRQKTDALSSKPNHVRSSGGGGTPVIRVGLSRNARVKSLHTKH